jgi:type III secretory pathway component EscU
LNNLNIVWLGKLIFLVRNLSIFLFLLICSGGSPEMHRMLSIGLVRKAPIASLIAWLWIGLMIYLMFGLAEL